MTGTHLKNIGARALARFKLGYSNNIRPVLVNRSLKRRERRAPPAIYETAFNNFQHENVSVSKRVNQTEVGICALLSLLAGMMVWFCSVSAQAGEAMVWGSDVTNALQTARTNRRPVLIQFSAPWCPYCRQMESKTFKDPAVESSLEQFERVSVNIDQNAALAAQHAVRGIPAFVMLDPDGDEAAKTTGFMEAEPFNKWLVESMTNLTVSTSQKEEFENQSREMETALGSADPTLRVRGLNMVLDCCDRKEKLYRAFGLEKLETLAKTDPLLLLEGLKHPGLMARIRVANLLRKKLGEEFNIDPWEKAGVREAAVQAWKAKLAAQADPTGR